MTSTAGPRAVTARCIDTAVSATLARLVERRVPK